MQEQYKRESVLRQIAVQVVGVSLQLGRFFVGLRLLGPAIAGQGAEGQRALTNSARLSQNETETIFTTLVMRSF